MNRFLRALVLCVPVAALLLLGCTQTDNNPKVKEKVKDVPVITPPVKPGGQ